MPRKEATVDIEERIKLYKKISMSLSGDSKSVSQPSSGPANKLDDAIKAIRNLSLPTKYEDPFIYRELMEAYKCIDRAANHPRFLLDSRFSDVKNLYPYKRSPVIGTYPTGEVNALAIGVPNSTEYLVVFESDLINFCYLFSKVVAQTLPLGWAGHIPTLPGNGSADPEIYTDDEIIQMRDEASYNSAQRLFELLWAYLIEGTPAAAPKYLLQEPYRSAAGVLVHSMEFFIMGHEYSHIRLGHVDETKTVKSQNIPDVEEFEYSWNQEYEADKYGALLATEAMRQLGYGDSIGYIGSELSLIGFHLLNRASSIIETGQEVNSSYNDSSESHPSSNDRRKTLASLLANQIGENDISGIRELEAIIEKLWSKICPILTKGHNRRLHPHFS
jgi:hypothetical protein